MNSSYHNLNFQRQPGKRNSKVIATIIVLAAFILLWFVFPHNVLFWILLLPLLCLSWSASYGFRQALSDLIKILQRIEQK
jgi:hypothetical protein